VFEIQQRMNEPICTFPIVGQAKRLHLVNEQTNEEFLVVREFQRMPSLSNKKKKRKTTTPYKTRTDLIQAILNARLYIQSTKPAILSGDENILSCESTLSDRLARFGFIAVGLGRIWRGEKINISNATT
jgi:hypothetical protein